MNVIIVGAGGHGRVALDILRAAGGANPVGFIDADTSRAGTTVDGLPVLGPVNLLSRLQRQDVRGVVIAIGDNRIRCSYAELVLENGLELVSAIHPRAVLSPAASLGRNVLLAAGAIVGPGARLADNVIVNTGAIVDHECELRAGVHIAPGAVLAGRVQVDEQAMVGLGARVIPCMRVGQNAVVGAGAVVIEDVPPGATVVGVPARVVRISTGPPSAGGAS